MKSKMIQVTLLMAMVTIWSGCSSMKFTKIDQPIEVDGKIYTALLTERVQPWGTSATTLTLVESTMAQTSQRQQVPMRAAVVPPILPQAELLTQTHVANSNNQGSTGWAGGAFNGSVGNALVGGSMMGAARLIRPARISAQGSASACASSQ